MVDKWNKNSSQPGHSIGKIQDQKIWDGRCFDLSKLRQATFSFGMEKCISDVTLSTALLAVKLEENLGTIVYFPAIVKPVDTSIGWSNLSCSYWKGGVEKVSDIFHCKKCKRDVKFPVRCPTGTLTYRYRLKLLVNDDQTSTIMLAFDDDAQFLPKFTAPKLTPICNEEKGA